MIRHIVIWKLAAADDAARDIAAQEIVDAFAGIEKLIPEIVSIAIERNVAFPDANWDLTLIADYESVADLEAYQKHPEHERAASVARARVAQRASIDFEV